MPDPVLTHVFFLTVDGIEPPDAGLTPAKLGMVPRVVDQFDLRGRSQSDLADLVDYPAFRARYNGTPSAGEIGCALAHRHCWSTLLAEGGDVALVCEDDAVLGDGDSDFLRRVMTAIPEWDLINLRITHGTFRNRPLVVAPGIDAYRATVTCFGTHAYLINREGATHFLRRQTPLIRNFADWPDEVWKLSMWGVRGGPVALRDRPSTLGRHPAPTEATQVEQLVHAGRALHFRLRRAYRLRVLGDVSF